MARQIDANALGAQNIKTYTAGKGEFGSGTTIGDINVTVNAGAMTDHEELAYEVARRIQKAIGDASNANMMV
jgi:hypothetical protein